MQAVWEEGAEQPLPSGEEAVADAVEGAEEEAGTSRGTFAQLRPSVPATEARRPAPRSERREPTFTAPDGAAAPGQPRGALTPAERHTLQAALAELAECRRQLDAALDETA